METVIRLLLGKKTGEAKRKFLRGVLIQIVGLRVAEAMLGVYDRETIGTL